MGKRITIVLLLGLLTQSVSAISTALIGSLKQPLQPSILVDYKLTEGAGQTVSNYHFPDDPHVNLIGMPEQNFARTTYWVVSGAVATDRVAVDPSGTTNASQIVATSGSRAMYQDKLTLAAGTTYTVSLWVAAVSGTKTFRLAGHDGVFHYSPDFTATTTWTRFYTNWVAAGTANGAVYILPDAAANDYDVYIWGFQLEAGSSPTAYNTNRFHGFLGRRGSADTWDVAWGANKYLDMTGSKQVSSCSSAPYAMTNASVYAIVQWKGTPVLNGYGPALMTQDNTLLLGLGAACNTSGRSPIFFRFNNGSAATTSAAGDIADTLTNEWHVLAGTYDGTTISVYLDGQLCKFGALANNSIVFNTLYIGNQNLAGYWPGYFGGGLVYTNSHNFSQMLRNSRALQLRLRDMGEIPTQIPKWVVWEGDSITVLNVNYYPYFASTNGTYICGHQCAVTGSTIADMVTRQPTVNSYANGSPYTRKVLSVLIGANDLGTLGAATWVANLKSYCNTMRACGWKIMLCTVLPRNNAAFNTERAIANPAIRADTSFYDALADFAADPTMGPDAAAADVSLYGDGIHPTTLGHSILGPIARTTLNGL